METAPWVKGQLQSGVPSCGCKMVRQCTDRVATTPVKRTVMGGGATNTYKKIRKAFGNDSLSCAQVFWWPKDFVNGRETVENELRFGCPASMRTGTNADHVRAFLCQNRHLAIWIIADELNECTVHQIVTQDLNWEKCAKMVAKNLNHDQKACRNKVQANIYWCYTTM
jgi:hypothetical protein